jgi:3-hydroxybutyryl-CoA dehydrogenase
MSAEQVAIIGSGTIACGLAATVARSGDVVLWARSDDSADRASARVAKLCQRLENVTGAERVRVTTRLDALDDRSFLVEAIAEDVSAKREILRAMDGHAGPEAILATTTSSLSIADLAVASGRSERFVGFHVFNPVPQMKLTELVFPADASADTRARAHALCTYLGKHPVEVPDCTGFVVNRLLFPYLFSAVRLAEETHMAPAQVDACMVHGAGHPMGPLALLDFVGLDVAVAIGESLAIEVPRSLRDLVAGGALGRKAGRGLYNYSD